MGRWGAGGSASSRIGPLTCSIPVGRDVEMDRGAMLIDDDMDRDARSAARTTSGVICASFLNTFKQIERLCQLLNRF